MNSTLPFFTYVYDSSTSETAMMWPFRKWNCQFRVSEAKPPPESRSGQKCPLEVQIVVDSTVFKGVTMGVVSLTRKQAWASLKPIKGVPVRS